MVFGRKVTSEESCPKPSPPSVDQILEDLKAADPDDPVFRLNPSKLAEEDSGESENLDYEQNFRDVSEYVSKEKIIVQLQDRIQQGFENLVSSQQELESVSASVASQLETIKKERSKVDLGSRPDTGKKEEETSAKDCSDGEDLC